MPLLCPVMPACRGHLQGTEKRTFLFGTPGPPFPNRMFHSGRVWAAAGRRRGLWCDRAALRIRDELRLHAFSSSFVGPRDQQSQLKITNSAFIFTKLDRGRCYLRPTATHVKYRRSPPKKGPPEFRSTESYPVLDRRAFNKTGHSAGVAHSHSRRA